MNKLLMDIYFMFKSVVTLLLIALSIWTFWHGCKFQTYGFEIELYGIGRYQCKRYSGVKIKYIGEFK